MKSEIKKGVVLSYLFLAISNIVSILYTPFLIRQLGQSEYGLYSLINSIIGYLSILDLGFGSAIVVYTSKYRALNKKEAENRLHGMFFLIFSIIGLITSVAGFILFLNADNMFASTMTDLELQKAKILLLIMTFNIAISFPFSIYSSIITAYEKFVFQKIIAIARVLINPIIMIPILFMGYKSIALTIVITVLNIICLMINYFYCKKKLNISVKFNGFDTNLFKEIFAYSFFIFINTIVDKVNWSADQIILGAVSGTIAVSIYSVASQFNSMYLAFSTAISGVNLPKITRMISTNASDEEVSNEFIKIGRIQYYLMLLIITGFIFFGKEFIILWAGSEYELAYYIALILMIPVTIPLTQNTGISILQAKNMHKFRSVVYICIALVNIVLSIPLAKSLGGIGSAIGTALALIIGNIITMNIYYYYKANINIPKYWKNILSISYKEVVPIVFMIVFLNVFKISGITKLLIGIPLYCIIYSIYTYFIVFNDYEKLLIKEPISKVLKKVEVLFGKYSRT